MRIDCHVHAFDDRIVERAMTSLRAKLPEGYASSDGRVTTLLDKLEKHGFSAAVLCTIATKPSQFEVLMKWLDDIRSGKQGRRAASMLVPLPSVHPDSPVRFQQIEAVAKAGFLGVKIHPYYQKCRLDSESTIDFMRCVRDNELVVVTHCGYDIGFARDPIATPAMLAHLLDQVPGLKLVAAHLGGWQDWSEVDRLLIGREVYMDISMTQKYLSPATFRDMILRHPADYLLYGSDWPWSDQTDDIQMLDRLDLPADFLASLMGGNAASLFQINN